MQIMQSTHDYNKRRWHPDNWYPNGWQVEKKKLTKHRNTCKCSTWNATWVWSIWLRCSRRSWLPWACNFPIRLMAKEFLWRKPPAWKAPSLTPWIDESWDVCNIRCRPEFVGTTRKSRIWFMRQGHTGWRNKEQGINSKGRPRAKWAKCVNQMFDGILNGRLIWSSALPHQWIKFPTLLSYAIINIY